MLSSLRFRANLARRRLRNRPSPFALDLRLSLSTYRGYATHSRRSRVVALRHAFVRPAQDHVLVKSLPTIAAPSLPRVRFSFPSKTLHGENNVCRRFLGASLPSRSSIALLIHVCLARSLQIPCSRTTIIASWAASTRVWRARSPRSTGRNGLSAARSSS